MDAGLSTPWQCSVVIGLKSHTCLAGALNGLAARAARRSAVLTGLTAAFFESSLSEVPALNVSLREANSICSTSGIGRNRQYPPPPRAQLIAHSDAARPIESELSYA